MQLGWSGVLQAKVQLSSLLSSGFMRGVGSYMFIDKVQAISLNGLTYENTRPVGSTETSENCYQTIISNNKSEDRNYTAEEARNLSSSKGYV